jgi:hypothetical protein
MLAAAEWISQIGINVSAIGGQNMKGDCNMDTDGGDDVPAWTQTTLYVDNIANVVRVRIQFWVQEDGGDHTRIEGDHNPIILRGEERKILGIQAQGGPVHSFETTVRGENHGWNPFPNTSGIYWEALTVKVDEHGSHDCDAVGIKGQLSLRVNVQ